MGRLPLRGERIEEKQFCGPVLMENNPVCDNDKYTNENN